MADKTPAPSKATQAPESGGVWGWVKGLFSPSSAGQNTFDGRGDEKSPEQIAEAERLQDQRYREAKEKADKLNKYEVSVMRGGPSLMKMLAGVGGSMIGVVPTVSDVRFGQFLFRERDGIAKFHQSVFIGAPYPDGEKMASILGLGRILNSAVSHGEFTKHEAAALMHEAMVSITGHVVGRETWWQRMIGAGVHAAADPIEHGVTHQMEVQQKNIVALTEKLKKIDLKALPADAEKQMLAMLNGIQEKGADYFKRPGVSEAYAGIAPPPATPAKLPTPPHANLHGKKEKMQVS